MTPRMLAALTGAPASFEIVTGMPESFAACANSFAGRACRPCDDPMRTVRVMGGMSVLFLSNVVGGLQRPVDHRGDRILDQRERPAAVQIA